MHVTKATNFWSFWLVLSNVFSPNFENSNGDAVQKYNKMKIKLNYVQSIYIITLVLFCQKFLVDSQIDIMSSLSTDHFIQPQRSHNVVSTTHVRVIFLDKHQQHYMCCLAINYKKFLSFIFQGKLSPNLEDDSIFCFVESLHLPDKKSKNYMQKRLEAYLQSCKLLGSIFLSSLTVANYCTRLEKPLVSR